AGGDQIASLLELHADPSRVPSTLSLRTLNAGGFGPAGEGKYMINRYLRERGDTNIRSNADLISKARFYQDPNFPDRKQAREQAERATTLDMSARLQGRLAGPLPATLPVGIDFIARPFDEPLLFRIASAYEAATHHRRPPPEFGPVR